MLLRGFNHVAVLTADSDRLHLLGDKSGQSLIDCHAQISNTFAAQPDGCGQNEIGAIRFEQIGRANIGSEPLCNQRDDVHEGLCRLTTLDRQMLNLLFRQDIPDCTRTHTLIHSFCGIVSAQFFVLTSTKPSDGMVVL